MQNPSEIQAAATARGLAIKRNNAVMALAVGGGLALLLGGLFGFKPMGFLVGLVAGLVYANAFEYCFHRFLLHLPGSFLGEQHLVHHSTWGQPDEMQYANFASTPWAVALLFLLNAMPFVVAEWVLAWGLAPGVLTAFTAYFIVFEEIHWRIHLGSRLPSWLQPARRHHLTHHAAAEERFNVFLPLFDRLLGPRTR